LVTFDDFLKRLQENNKEERRRYKRRLNLIQAFFKLYVSRLNTSADHIAF